MKKVSVSTALGSIMLASMAFAVNQAAAVGLPVIVNNEVCGTYTDVVFDKSGKLNLTGNLTCLSEGGAPNPPGPTDPNPPGPTDPNPPGPTDPGIASCGAPPADLIARNDVAWLQRVATNSKQPVVLKDSQIFSLKINKPAGKNGYGTFDTINLTMNAGARTAVVSECPGSMKSITAGLPIDACKVVGMETGFRWTFDKQVPAGVYECRLDPNKQYYINITHQDHNGKNSCVGSQCYFSYNHRSVELN